MIKTIKSRKAANISGINPCQICGRKTFLHTHHLAGRDILNPNHSSNLADICPTCHTEIHMGYLVIEGWFTTSNGKELLWHYNEEESFSGRDITPYIIGSAKE